jgi:hypothetical protein
MPQDTGIPVAGLSTALPHAVIRTQNISGTPRSELPDALNRRVEKIVEESQPMPREPLLRGHISETLAGPNHSAAESNAPDGRDSGLMVRPNSIFENPLFSDSNKIEIDSIAAEHEKHDVPEFRGDVTPSAPEAANPMIKPAFSHQNSFQAIDGATINWRSGVERIAGEIVRHVQINKREAILHLDPPELGRIKIDLHLNGDKLQAHIFTEAGEARSMIENHIQELRQALQANNLELVDVRVQGGWHGGAGDAMHGFLQQQQHQPAAQQEWRRPALGQSSRWRCC